LSLPRKGRANHIGRSLDETRLTEREALLMTEAASGSEWDQLVNAMGKLTLAAGTLEMAVIAIVCRVVGKTEEEVGGIGKWRSNKWWCDELNKVASNSWPAEERQALPGRLENVRAVYRRRNRLIHAAVGQVADGSIAGVSAGSAIDLRTYGFGFKPIGENAWAIVKVGNRIGPEEIDKLTEEIQAARLSLVPYMKLADQIMHPPKPFPFPVPGKLP
jgi:hypothetical protein